MNTIIYLVLLPFRLVALLVISALIMVAVPVAIALDFITHAFKCLVAIALDVLTHACCYDYGSRNNNANKHIVSPYTADMIGSLAKPDRLKDNNASQIHAELEQRRQKAMNPAQQMHNQRSAGLSQQSPAANESYFARLTRRFSPW